MKTITISVPDNVAQRLDKLVDALSEDYISVNTSEVIGQDALLTDLLILGLDEIAAGEAEFPDDD